MTELHISYRDQEQGDFQSPVAFAYVIDGFLAYRLDTDPEGRTRYTPAAHIHEIVIDSAPLAGTHRAE